MAINKSTAAAHEIIAAPGDGKRLAIDFLTLNPSGGVNTLTITCAISIPAVLNDNQPITWENAIQDPEGILHCDNNQAFSITLANATQVEGFVSYRIING